MKKKIVYISVFLLLLLGCFSVFYFYQEQPQKTTSKKLSATVLSSTGKKLVLQDNKNIIYTFGVENAQAKAGEEVVLEYTGLLDKTKSQQESSVMNVDKMQSVKDENGIQKEWLDGGIFSNFYILANNKLKELSLDERIAQILLVDVPEGDVLQSQKQYQFGGFLFKEDDFSDKTEEEVIKMIQSDQEVSKVPLLTAVDEEGGDVVRVSSNDKLVEEPFKSPKDLYEEGGLSLIREDTINKSKILSHLGLNVNLAPVVDVAKERDYIYDRTLQKDVKTTSEFAKAVIEASKDTGVSYTLKHFPGYGSNQDTHSSSSSDERDYETLKKEALPPFQSGIDAGAEAVLVNHNTMQKIDEENPASLSASIHNILRHDMDFTGIIMTDDLAMNAVSSIDHVYVKAILAGNDLLITSKYEEAFTEIKEAVKQGSLSEELISKLAFRVLAWKYYKGLMFVTK